MESKDVPLIQGCPFLATNRDLIDMQKGELIFRLNDEEMTINIFNAFKFDDELDSCFRLIYLT